MSFSLQGTFHSLNKERGQIHRWNIHKKKEKRPCFYPCLIRRFFFTLLLHIKHWSSVSLLQWKITANLNYLPSLKSMSVYMLVPPLFADTSFPRKSLLLKSSELYNFSFHDRLEGNSHPLMASWAEISKQADVDCNNLKGEIRVGYLFPLMRKWRKLFVISGEFLRALEMLKDRRHHL